MTNPRGNRSDRVPRRADLPNVGPQCPGLKDAHRSNHPHLPKDNEEVNAHIKHLQAILDAGTVGDLVHDREDGGRGHELGHRQSPHGDSASSITPPKEHDRECGWDGRNLSDIICGRDACDQIKNRHESESAWNRINAMRGIMIIMVPTMTTSLATLP
jgi:hypothetical protein